MCARFDASSSDPAEAFSRKPEPHNWNAHAHVPVHAHAHVPAHAQARAHVQEMQANHVSLREKHEQVRGGGEGVRAVGVRDGVR